MQDGYCGEIMAKINTRQKKFAEYVVQGMSRDQAYLKAGYNAKHPNRAAFNLMAKPHVDEYIKQLQKDSTDETIATLLDCKKKLTEIIMSDCEPKAVLIKAIDQLSKLSQWEKQHIQLDVRKTAEELSDEELARLVSE